MRMAMLTNIMGLIAFRRLFDATSTMMMEGSDKRTKQRKRIPISGPNALLNQTKARIIRKRKLLKLLRSKNQKYKKQLL